MQAGQGLGPARHFAIPALGTMEGSVLLSQGYKHIWFLPTQLKYIGLQAMAVYPKHI